MMWDFLCLLWRNVDRSKPTFYTVDNLGTVQQELIEALRSDSYTYIIDGGLQAAATWYVRDDGVIVVTNAGCNKGYMTQLIKAIRAKAKFKGAIWHRPKWHSWKDFPRQRSAECGN